MTALALFLIGEFLVSILLWLFCCMAQRADTLKLPRSNDSNRLGVGAHRGRF